VHMEHRASRFSANRLNLLGDQYGVHTTPVGWGSLVMSRSSSSATHGHVSHGQVVLPPPEDPLGYAAFPEGDEESRRV